MRGRHPNSLQNLQHEGRPPAWGETKKVRRLTVTDEGWSGVQLLAQKAGCSVSELLERLGRGQWLPSIAFSSEPEEQS